MLEKIMSYKIFGNEGVDYAIALGVFLVLILAFFLVQKIIIRKIEKATKKTETELDEFL
jgi:flagellar biosynthesis/type III secretory pathway M-ring protein FliF/YscJ